MMTGRAQVAQLQISLPDQPDSELSLSEGDSLRIGRFEGNDVLINDNNVSRFHAVINAGEGSLFLTDLASLNGTSVNGQRITIPVRLHHRDLIEIVDAKFLVILEEHLREVDPSATDSSATQALAMRPLRIVALVADVNGYTKMSEAISNGDVSEMLDCWLDLVARVVKAHGGTVENIQGDSLLGIWRIEESPLSEAVERYAVTEAVRAAIEMQESVDKLCELGSWRHQSKFPWRFKVSIHRGGVLEGVIGRGEVREFTLVGDTVNVAFRLNGLAHQFERNILLSGEVAAYCDSNIRCEKLGSHSLEGRKEQIAVYSAS